MDKVLQMTRIETGALPLERDWAAPDEIVAGALARLSDRLATHRVLTEIPTDLPLLRVDAALIEQALVNLLDNAARHTPPGTVVRVRVKRLANELVLGVEDTGEGLDAAARERLFAKFERGSPERGARGVGLGLAIARAIVGLHGGRAWAEPGPGGGLAVLLALPVEAAPAPPADEGDA